MKKNGFTMVELLAVLVILGIIMMIAVPAISKLVSSTDEDYYASLEGTLRSYGQDYFQDRRTLLPKETGNVKEVSIQTLVNQKYGDEPKDMKGNPCKGRILVQRKATNEYEYVTCLECADYRTTKAVCSYSEEDNGKIVITGVENAIVKQGSNFTPPIARATINGETLGSVNPSPSWIDTNLLTTYDVYYTYRTASKMVRFTVTDQTKPSAVKVTLTLANGSTYNQGWTNQSVFQTFEATDWTKDGVQGSGIKGFLISYDNGKQWTLLNANQGKLSMTQTDVTDTKVMVKAVDNVGNEGPVASYQIRIEREKPTCVSSGGSSAWGEGRTIYGTCTDKGKLVSGCVQNQISKFINYDTTTASAGSVCDKAGNCVECPKNQQVRLDNTAPTFTVSGNHGIWQNTSVKLTISAQDTGSGLDSRPYSFDGGKTWGSYNSTWFNETSTITVAVRDKKGNIAKQDYKVLIDWNRPTFTTTVVPNVWSRGEATVTVNASDTGGSGIKSMTWSYSDYYNNTSNPIAFNKTFKTDKYRLRVTVTDYAGNSTTQYVYTKVDNVAPFAPVLDIELTQAESTVRSVTCSKNEDSYENNYCTITANGRNTSWWFGAIDNYKADSGSSGVVKTCERILVNGSVYRNWVCDDAGPFPRVTISNASRKDIHYQYMTYDGVGLASPNILDLKLIYPY